MARFLNDSTMLQRISLLTVALYAIFAWSIAAPVSAQGSNPAAGIDEILSYASDVTVNRDSTLLVRETVRLYATRALAESGIYRDFATRYSDRFGNPYFVHIEVDSLELDGDPIDFYLRKLANGVRIYLGAGATTIPPGEHTYELTYTVDRALGLFFDHDELYWDATGNGWALPIQAASASVHLPGGIAQEAILMDAYTGRPGSAQTGYTASADRQGNITFRTTRPLEPYESLTIVVRWPKGFVRPPTDEQKQRYFLEENRPSLIGLLGIVAVLICYLIAWTLAGRDPNRGEIAPRAEPPKGFSPAALRYAWRAAFDQKALVADLIDLAIKGRFAILEDATGAFILGRAVPSPRPGRSGRSAGDRRTRTVTRDEKLVLERIFSGEDTIRLDLARRARVGSAIEALHQRLRSKMERVYLAANSRYLGLGLLISIATVVRSGWAVQGSQRVALLWGAMGVLPGGLACMILGTSALAAWKNALSNPHYAPAARKRATLTSLVFIGLLVGEFAGLVLVGWASTPLTAILLLILVAINCIAHVLLKGPARSGRALMNQIEGLRSFLTATEETRREAPSLLKSPPEVFERVLPYAIAFNLEKIWSEKFAAIVPKTARTGTSAYSPSWYSGPSWDPVAVSTFATSLSGFFSSAISSSLRAPGSKARHSSSSQDDEASRT